MSMTTRCVVLRVKSCGLQGTFWIIGRFGQLECKDSLGMGFNDVVDMESVLVGAQKHSNYPMGER